jgi:ketosteroid isomerase-like protein
MNTNLRDLSQHWASAELTGDADFIDGLLLDDFVAIGPRGFVLSKDQWLARHREGRLRYQRFDWDEVEVHEHGNSAIVIGRETTSATYDGQPTPAPVLRVLEVFVKDASAWKVAAIQHSPIQQENR